MNCSDWEREIAGEAECEGLEEHLQGCEHCAAFARELEANRVALRELVAPAAAFDAVRRRVLQQIQAKKRRAVWWGWSAVAAAACVAILCVSFVAPRMRNPLAPEPFEANMDPPAIQWTPKPIHHRSSGRLTAKAAPAQKTEPFVVKMLTNDPNVIIIWLVDQKGDSL
jgi:anti-sigma factor RsiW